MKFKKGYLLGVFIVIILFQLSSVLAIKNPAAVYCNELGYRYSDNYTEYGAVGICNIDSENLSFNAWEFFQGKVGKQYSYCSKIGYDTVTLNDGKNSYSPEYGACVIKNNTIKHTLMNNELAITSSNHDNQTQIVSIVDLMNLSEKVKEPNIQLNNTVMPKSMSVANLQTQQSYNLPSSFNWMDYNGYNWLTSGKDQGLCGSCWAFASVGAVESKYKIEENLPNWNIDLSEQFLIDCSGKTCNSGDYPSNALEFIKTKGITDEACLPYSWTGWFNQKCSDRCSDWDKRLYKIYDWKYVSYNDNEIKKQLIENGPMAVTIYVGGWWDQLTGLYECDNTNPENYHAVVLVGYNDVGKYWMVKNSWGWLGDLLEGTKIGYGQCGLGKLPMESIIVFAPPDSDRDGIPDSQDSCPNTYGTYCNGCPVPACQQGYYPTCPSTGSPYCTNVINCRNKTDCGDDSFSEGGFCTGNNLSSFFASPSCVNPNTTNSYCIVTYSIKTKDICNFGCLNETCLNCLKDTDCGNNQTINYCDDKNSSWKMDVHPKCNNPGTALSYCFNDSVGKASPCQYGCSSGECTFGYLNINFPIETYYNTKKILFDINTSSITSKIDYKDNSVPKSKFTNLCIKCSKYNKLLSFDEGYHIIEIIANNSIGSINKTINFFIDSKAPQIISYQPKNNAYTNGSNFLISYNEANLIWASLVINNAKINQSCPPGNQQCIFNADVSQFNGQNIQYYFILKDIAGNTAQSRPTNIYVDTTPPKISNLNSFWNQSGKYINFNIIVNETNLDSIKYLDNTQTRWSTLCSNLKNGICNKKLSFRTGPHNLTIQVLDKAGNSAQQSISFTV